MKMVDLKKDSRFAGLEPFRSKIWNGVYYWGNQEEKP
jgi:hypothetical protein